MADQEHKPLLQEAYTSLEAAVEEGKALLGTPEEQEARQLEQAANRAEYKRVMAEAERTLTKRRQHDLEPRDIDTTPNE